MERVAEFKKVSFEQFKNDILEVFDEFDEVPTAEFLEDHIRLLYDNIKLPKRATAGSAGYDFFCPVNITLKAGESVKIPTGIRCQMREGWVLMEFPRSGLGFKFGVHMANTVGIIDEDYYYSDNEGHIFIKLVNDSVLAKDIKFDAGNAFCQGIFVPFGITVDDEVTTVRNGGMGSTGR